MENYRNKLEIISPATWKRPLLETVVANSVVCALLLYVRPDDPFLIHESFPWLLFLPVMIGLMHGFGFAFISLGLLVIGMMLTLYLGHWHTAEIPYAYIAGIGLLSLICGEFRDVWARRMLRLKEASLYRQRRLDEFSRSYYLLKVSHDELEQRFLSSPYNLQNAITTIRRKIFAGYTPAEFSPEIVQAVLDLFIEHSSLQRAAIFRVEDNTHVLPEPLATHGKNVEIDPADPLITYSIARQELLSMHPDLRDTAGMNSRLQVALPFVDAHKRVWAVLAIEKMPFFTFHEKTFKMLAVLACYTADMLRIAKEIVHVPHAEWADFAVNIKRALMDWDTFDLPSALLVYTIKKTGNEGKIMSVVMRILQGLDVAITQEGKDQVQMLVLFPLTDKLGVNDHMARFHGLLQGDYGLTRQDAPMTLHHHQLTTVDRLASFAQDHIWKDFYPVLYISPKEQL